MEADANAQGTLNGIALPPGACAVLAALETAGFEAWVVGGWVRDALMGASGHDVDMCCSAPWQESARALGAAGLGVVESGVKFGGITALAMGERIEVTTFRVDGFYTDGRHPEEVRAAQSVDEDVARRDFTVNAMAWHPVRGLFDPFDGRGDIDRRLIRAVGDARTRFEEDALRMLRAVRFACRLDFSLEQGTGRALAGCAPLLDAVARERVGVELTGILETGHAARALAEAPELMCAAIPELAACRGFDQRTRYHIYDVYDHTARVLAALGERSCASGVPVPPALWWAALLHDVAKPACFTQDKRGRGHFYGHPQAGERLAHTVMRRLGLPERMARETGVLIRYHDMPVEPERASLLKLLGLLSQGGADVRLMLDELIELRCADALGKAPSCFGYVDELERLREMVYGLIDAGEPYSLRQLAISGTDLIVCGVEPGKRIGELLQRALDGCVAGEVANEKSALLAYVGVPG